MLAAKASNLSSVPKDRHGRRRDQTPPGVFYPPHVCHQNTRAPCTHKNNNNDNSNFKEKLSAGAVMAAGEGLGSPWDARVDRHGGLCAGDPAGGCEQLCVRSTKVFGDLWFGDFPRSSRKLLRFLPFK